MCNSGVGLCDSDHHLVNVSQLYNIMCFSFLASCGYLLHPVTFDLTATEGLADSHPPNIWGVHLLDGVFL